MATSTDLEGPIMDQRDQFSIPIAEKMLAACSGSFFTSFVITPFDVIRVRLQQQSAVATPSPKMHPVQKIPAGVGVTACCKDVFWFPSTIDYCVASTRGDLCQVESRKITGTWDGLKKISQYEGLTTLWRGLSLTLLMSIPANVVYFISYEHMRDNCFIKSDLLNPLICGSLARSFSSTVVSPIELMKTRLQSIESSSKAFPVVLNGIRSLVREKGVLSLWRGLVLTLWRDVPFSGIYWASVEYIRKKLRQSTTLAETIGHNAFTESFIAGSVGGTIAAVATTPFDVGKTRRQLCHDSARSINLKMLPFMYHILKTEGLPALYVGLIPRVLKVAPACAIMISSYEVSKKMLHDRQPQSKFNINDDKLQQ